MSLLRQKGLQRVIWKETGSARRGMLIHGEGQGGMLGRGFRDNWGWHKGCRNGESRYSASSLVQFPIYSLKRNKVTSLE